MELNAEILIPGEEVAGECLALTAPISFWGGIDPRSGTIIDARHPQRGLSIAGAVLGAARDHRLLLGLGGAARTRPRRQGPGRDPDGRARRDPAAGPDRRPRNGLARAAALRVAGAEQGALAGRRLLLSKSGAITTD